MSKAAACSADALILDLEDSVSLGNKETARSTVASFLSCRDVPMKRYVRVNALTSGLVEADIAATAPAQPDGYVLPKCEGPADIESLSQLIEKYDGGQSIVVMAIATETVKSLRSLMRENWSHPRLAALCWGAEDLAWDMGASRNRDQDGAYLGPFRLARDMTLLAALEAGVAAVDSVFTDFRDHDGLAMEARRACELGFVGKLAIHPAQISHIHDAMRPSPADIDWAEAVIAGFETNKDGVFSINGDMIDRPHLERARKILEMQNRDF
jgi:citrate lyase subunit beta/citryl-CoA lyase